MKQKKGMAGGMIVVVLLLVGIFGFMLYSGGYLGQIGGGTVIDPDTQVECESTTSPNLLCA